MQNNPITIELSSHTDSRGSNKYNERLSQRRAESAVNYIVGKGIEASRVTAKGYGEYQLVNRCSDGVACSPAEHQANRRTEFKVLGYIKQPARQLDTLQAYEPGKELSRDELPTDFFASLQKPVSKEPMARELTIDKSAKSTTAGYLIKPASNGCLAVEIMVNSMVIDLNDPIWRNLSDKNRYFDGNSYHYLVGCTTNTKQAEQQLKRMQALGFTSAKLVKLNAEGIVRVE
jgi:hypothetical protein